MNTQVSIKMHCGCFVKLVKIMFDHVMKMVYVWWKLQRLCAEQDALRKFMLWKYMLCTEFVTSQSSLSCLLCKVCPYPFGHRFELYWHIVMFIIFMVHHLQIISRMSVLLQTTRRELPTKILIRFFHHFLHKVCGRTSWVLYFLGFV